jgi:hypothetical protein
MYSVISSSLNMLEASVITAKTEGLFFQMQTFSTIALGISLTEVAWW